MQRWQRLKTIQWPIQIVKYPLETDKVSEPIRICLLTDLHNRYFGAQQSELLQAIDRMKPQLVLLGGDIFQGRSNWSPAQILIQYIATYYPVFYVTGNHEYETGIVDEVVDMVSDLGVTVLRGQTVTLTNGYSTIELTGIDDAEHCDCQQALLQSTQNRQSEAFQILLAHRPEWVRQYLPYQFDLILTGSSRRSGWSWSPRRKDPFTGGLSLYSEYGTTLIASRGLYRGRNSRPELVCIQIESTRHSTNKRRFSSVISNSLSDLNARWYNKTTKKNRSDNHA